MLLLVFCLLGLTAPSLGEKNLTIHNLYRRTLLYLFIVGALTLTSSSTTTSITVSWGNYPAYIYQVKITPGSADEVKLPATATGYTFNNLTPSMAYTVSVIAVFLDGTKENPVTKVVSTASTSKTYLFAFLTKHTYLTILFLQTPLRQRILNTPI